MIPVLSQIDYPYEAPSSPELRRMDMFNRARREEMDSMLFGLNSRYAVSKTGSRTRTRQPLIARLVNGMRAAIGTTLIAAGNRIHTAA